MRISRSRENPELSLVYVNFRSVRSLRKSIRSLFRDQGPSGKIEIIVANNDPMESWALQALKREFPLRIVEICGNPGFGTAANIAVPYARSPYVGFINPDTELVSGNLSDVVGVFRKYGDIGILGGRLVSADGIPETWSAGEEVSLWQVIRNNVGIPTGKRIWTSRRPKKAGFVSGAALFIRRNLFKRIGGFDPRFFLYFEDVDLCLRARRFGYRVFSFPGIVFRHDGGGSHLTERGKKEAFYVSQQLYFSKHRPTWEGKLLSAVRKTILL